MTYIVYFKIIFNRFNISVLTSLLHIYDITSHYCICLWSACLKMAEKSRNM